jgi:phage-related minor tail protein
MASQNIARLGVVLGLDTAEFTASIDKAISENAKLKNAIRRDTNSAAGELKALTHATEDYGKTLTKVELIQREVTSGKFMNATKDMKDRLLQQAAAYDKMAMSTKNAAGAQFKLNEQQKIQLTYQTTDLFTQIASGQSPFIAILQQGGQLKDVMGGVGNMFKAIGTLFTPFSVGLGAVAATLGVVAYAAYEAHQEFDKLQDNLTLTGNYAGLTANKLVDMSKSVADSAKTTIGNATSALDALVASGKFTSTSLEAVTTAVLTYSKIAGVDGKQAAEALMSGLNGTAAGAKTLNEKMNFLTLAQYKQIEALEKAGKQQEAAQLAANILNGKLEAQKRILGDMEQLWDKAKNAMSRFWAALKEAVAGPSTNVGILKKVNDEIEALEFTLSKSTGNPEYTKQERARLQILKERRVELEKIIKTAEKSVVPPSGKEEITEYDKYKGMLSAKENELQKSKIDTAFRYAQIGANEIEKLELESAKKIVDAYDEMRQKNKQEDGRATKQNLEIYKNKVTAAETELAEKKRQINMKRVIAQYNDEQAAEQEFNAAWAMEQNRRAALVVNAQNQTRDMEYQRESLDLKYKMIYATEEEQRLAQISLEYARKRKEVEGQDPFVLKELDRQEAIAKMFVTMDESAKRTQQVFDSVFGSLSSAIDNFVKTGKLSMKDLARSVIQDLIAIQMKAAAMKFLGGLFGAVSGGGGTNMSQFEYAKISGFADGGEPPVGRPSIVGERGPELFVPKTAGTIIPNHALSNMGSTTNVTNNYINAIDVKSFEDRLLGSSNTIWAANQYANKNLSTNFGRT